MNLLPSPYIICAGQEIVAQTPGVSFALATTANANRAYYYPFRLPSTQTLTSVSVYVGSAAGTIDLGLYDELCVNRLDHMGSTTAVTGVNTWTLASPTLVTAGRRLYLAISISSGSCSFARQSITAVPLRGGGVTMESSAHPLPTTATPVAMTLAQLIAMALTFRGF